MKTRLSFYLAVFTVLLFYICAEARTETDLSSFVHQVTRTQDSTSVTTRQWIYPVRISQVGKYGSLGIQTALMYVHQEDSTVVDTWGPLDTHASARLRLGAWGLLDLTAGLPSGKNNLEASEANLVRTLSRNDLNFPVKTFGQGLDLGVAGSLVNQAGHYGLSLGFSYLRKGIYTPLEGLGRYKPGDEAAVSLGLHYTRSRLSLHINTVGTVYLTDRLDGLVIFQNAKQFLLQAGLAYSGKTIQIRAELT
ncbi:MAG: hypothetical protein O2954_06560, partial [bacterium]|nr:hypothetical protein [bacterium]